MKKEEVFAVPQPRFRPPDFLLPQTEGSAARRRGSGPDIYVSWDGQVYGPTDAENILSGIKTSYFRQDAQFWFEGQENWQPLSTFPEIVEFSHEQPVAPPDPPDVAPPPSAAPPPQPSERRRKERHRRSRPHKNSRFGRRGRVVVLGFVILAALLTVGLLSLLMLI
jgi:hypothetical protein